MSTATKSKPKLSIKPLEDRVVIMPSEDSETMRGGLYIPDTAKEKPTQGEVVAVVDETAESGVGLVVPEPLGEHPRRAVADGWIAQAGEAGDGAAGEAALERVVHLHAPAATVRRDRPREGEGPGGRDRRSQQHAAGLSWLDLRQ